MLELLVIPLLFLPIALLVWYKQRQFAREDAEAAQKDAQK